MKIGKNRRGVSTVIAVLLMIIITVAAAVIVWAFLSGYIGARTAPAAQNTVFQINAVTKDPATPVASVQLLDLGTNGTIVGVYVNGVAATGFTPSLAKFLSTATPGTIVDITWTSPKLKNGDLLKLVCADGGAASATVV